MWVSLSIEAYKNVPARSAYGKRYKTFENGQYTIIIAGKRRKIYLAKTKPQKHMFC